MNQNGIKNEVEATILGTLLENHERFNDVKHVICEEMFENASNRKIFNFLKKKHDDNQPWDVLELADTYPDRAEVIYEMAEKSVLFSQFVEHFKNLQLRHFKNKLDISTMNSNQIEMSEIKAFVESFQLVTQEPKDRQIKEIFDEVATHVSEAGLVTPELCTGFKQINHWISGFIKKQIILIVAATGHSKSLFLWNLILKPLKEGKKIIVYDYEMTDLHLIARLIAMDYQIPLDWILRGTRHTGERGPITAEERQEVKAALEYMRDKVKTNLIIKSSANIDQIESDAVNIKPDIMVIDTIQAFCKKHRKSNGVNNADHITDLAGRLNDIVKTHDIAMIQAAQVNRATDGAIPSEANIRESSGIADNAAVIMGVRDRSKVSDKPEDLEVFDVRICKNRHGELGNMKFYLNKAIAKVYEYKRGLTIEEERMVEL